MKCHKLFLIGAFIMGMVIPTQAAVYGTLKQDMYFDVDLVATTLKANDISIPRQNIILAIWAFAILS